MANAAEALEDLWFETCEQHGRQLVVSDGSASGFTGATIYFTDLACGCQLIDASADNLAVVR